MGKGSLVSRVRRAREEKGEAAKKKGENNKAPVGAYILGKNCHGRKRMRGNRRGEGQDDGNLPADILCVSCERGSLPLSYTVYSSSSISLSFSFLFVTRYPPLFCLH